MRMGLMLLLVSVVFAGCTYTGQSLSAYIDEPQKIVQDPHFGGYKEKRDDLESQYLQKKITYVEYQEKLTDLDNKYNKEIKQRDEILSSAN